MESAPPSQPPQYQPTAEGAPPDQFAPLEPDDPDAEPRPWYRKPVALIAWALLVLILLALIAYGVSELLGGGKDTTPAPTTKSTTSATTTAPTSTTTTEPSTTTTTAEPSTTTTAAPPTNPPRSQPPNPPPTQTPTHRHLPPLPSTITIPGGPTITVPRLP